MVDGTEKNIKMHSIRCVCQCVCSNNVLKNSLQLSMYLIWQHNFWSVLWQVLYLSHSVLLDIKSLTIYIRLKTFKPSVLALPVFQSNIRSMIGLSTILQADGICLHVHQNRQYCKSMCQLICIQFSVGN